LFIAEPNYICPSRPRHTRNFDKAAVKVKDDLKKEIIRDVNEAGHKTVSITSDHGTSSDTYRTKKNAVTLARTTKNFVIKKDTITLINCEGSQTGAKIRDDVKKALILGAGWLRGTVPVGENPNIWWRLHQAEYPLLARFWMAHSSFPATSTYAERVFNMDGLILVPRR
jgi:hypothetical protein